MGEKENKVFLGNLSYDVSTADLEEMLKDEGYYFTFAKVIVGQDTGQSRGFAFVGFGSPEAASEAVAGLDGYQLAGRPIRASMVLDKSRSKRGGCSDRSSNQGRFDFSDDEDYQELWNENIRRHGT